MNIYRSIEEVPTDREPCVHATRRGVRDGFIEPTVEFCRRFTFEYATIFWRNSPKYANNRAKAKEYCIKTWEEWDAGFGAAYVDKQRALEKEQKALENKKEKIRQGKVRGGIGKQSLELKEILSKPISFKHITGICVTVLPQRSVSDVADELSKISFCEKTHLAKILARGSGMSKGWGTIDGEVPLWP